MHLVGDAADGEAAVVPRVGRAVLRRHVAALESELGGHVADPLGGSLVHGSHEHGLKRRDDLEGGFQPLVRGEVLPTVEGVDLLAELIADAQLGDVAAVLEARGWGFRTGWGP